MTTTDPSVASVGARLVARENGQTIPLEHVRIEARVADLCARVTVHQSYRNREAVPLEVVYVFPLDEGSAVCGFEAAVDGVRYHGTVMTRDEAFRKYDDAMEAGHGGFLLDEERADVFTASLGNVKPGSEVVLSITYVTELAAEGGAVRFTLPTTVSPRYAPETDRTGVGPTPNDALNPPVALDVPYAFSFEMDAAMQGAIRRVTSPSHPVDVEVDGTKARVRLAQRTASMDRDLVIVLAADGLDVPHAVAERGEKGGAVLVSFLPKFSSATQAAEVVFVIDRSGSMAGPSIEEVRNALQLCLRSLTPGCRFNIVSFGSEYETLFPASRVYDDESLKLAAQFVETMEADMGGTELLPAMNSVLEHAVVEGLPRQVLLLTDGEVTNTDAVIDVARRNAATARFFTFGIGAGASQHLVRGIARASGGAAEFISPGERIEEKVMRQFKRVFAPALTDVKVEWGQTETTPATEHVPPVFDGERLIVYALGCPNAPVSATLRGMQGGHEVRFDVPIDPASAMPGDTIATLAARARIRMLEEQGPYLESRGSRQRRRRSNDDVTAEITALGVKYQLCSRETSFVAIEERETPLTDRAELRRIPVALTSGWGGVRLEHMVPMMAASMAVQRNLILNVQPSAPAGLEALDAACCPLTDDAGSERFSGRFDRLMVMRATTSPPVRGRSHDALIALQEADGSWDLTKELVRAVGLEFQDLGPALAGAKGDINAATRALATALALAWLEKHASRARVEWEMLAAKAWRWLAACTATAAGGERWIDVASRLL